MTITREDWGSADGRTVHRYALTNAGGLTARIATYGATLVDLLIPDRDGVLADIVLGHERLDPYVATPMYFGATVGRVGNRIANARFELDGTTYALSANHGSNHLHGGLKGWDKVVWTAEPMDGPGGPSLRLSHVSPDGDEGYPGTVTAQTTYTLLDDDGLSISMSAVCDQRTLLNMVHHSYFNLDPGRRGDVRDHVVQLFGSRFTPGMPPDGTVVPVDGGPFDFREPKPIGRDVEAAGSPGAGAAPGFDGNWIVDGQPHELRPVARLSDPRSGRVMTIDANQPGVQFYSGVFLDGSTSGKGRTHDVYSGLCLESQAIPNAINVPEWRDQVILDAGQPYEHQMLLRFSVE